MPKVSPEYQQARRDQILGAAAVCFSRKGFAATSVPDIVAEAGLSVGAIYRYFKSKEELFLAVVQERVAVYNDAIFAELREPGTAGERIANGLRRLHGLLEARPPADARLSLDLWARAHDVTDLRQWLEQARSRRLQALEAVLQEGRANGELEPEMNPVDAATGLVALADGLVVQRACADVLLTSGDAVALAEQTLRVWKRKHRPHLSMTLPR